MNARVRRRTGGERLAVAVLGRPAADAATRERLLALVCMAECARPADARPTLAGLVELLELAREPAASWEEVRAEWRALCEAAEEAHRGAPGWVGAVRGIHGAGELELARLWGVSLVGSADADAAEVRGRV